MSTGVIAYAADAKVAVKGLINGTVIEIPIPASNSAMAVGDEVETAADGCVDLKSGAGEVVGVVMKAVTTTSGTGRFVTVWVCMRTAAS